MFHLHFISMLLAVVLATMETSSSRPQKLNLEGSAMMQTYRHRSGRHMARQSLRLMKRRRRSFASLVKNSGGMQADALTASQKGGEQAEDTSLEEPEEIIEPWVDSHGAIVSEFSEEQLGKLSEGVTGRTYSLELHGLVDPERSRFVAGTGNIHTTVQVEKVFRELGLRILKQDIPVTGDLAQYAEMFDVQNPRSNVVGILSGTDLANETVVLGAHLDSVNWENLDGDAPGVDDNGSGLALLMQAARTLARGSLRPRRNIAFVAFNGEELGLLGSKHFVQEVKSGQLGDIKAAIIADEVAYPGSGNGAKRAIFETVGTVRGASNLLDTFAHSANFHDGDGVRGFEVNVHGFGSDHISFLDEGIPAVLLIEREDTYHANTWGHSQRDTFEHVDLDYGAAMTRLALRALARLAWPSEPARSTPDIKAVS